MVPNPGKRGAFLMGRYPKKDGNGSALSIWSSYFAASILPGAEFFSTDRFTGHWNGSDQPLVIGLADHLWWL
jgi:hypothetical protein